MRAAIRAHAFHVWGTVMFRFIAAPIAAALVASALPAGATAAPAYATSFVQAAVPRGAIGRDAGVDLSQGSYVRVSASGAFASRALGCSPSVGPNGCGGTGSPAAPGTLVAAFADANGRLLSSWLPVGQYASLPVALGALLQSLQELPLFIRSTPFAELVMPRNVFPKEIQPAHSSSVVGVSAIDAISLAGLSLWNDGWNDGMTYGARDL